MDVNWERWGRAAGIAFVVFTIAAFIVGGEPPQVSDSAEDVVAYYDGERGQVLVSSFLFTVALGFWIWFGGTLANSLRSHGEGRVAATIVGAVAAFVSVQLVSTADQRSPRALGGASWRGRRHAGPLQSDLGSRRGCRHTECGLLSRRVSGAQADTHDPGVAECGRHRRRGPLHSSKHELGSEGFWSPTGEYLFILIPLALLWILTTSVILMRRREELFTLSEQVPASTV